MTPSLKFSANLKWLFTELPLEQRYDAAAAAGFKAAEFAWPYDYPVAWFQSLLKNSGLQQVLINTPAGKPGTPKGSGQACHPDSVAAFKTDFLTALEYADGLDCRTLHVQASIRQQGVSQQAAWATLVDNVRWAAEQAASSGITLVLEAINPNDSPDFILHTQQQSLAVMREVGAENVKLLFDIYHVQCSEGDVLARMRELYPCIHHVQVADAPGRHEPGSGELNWPLIFRTLQELHYDGWVGCEYRPATTTLAGLGWLHDDSLR